MVLSLSALLREKVEEFETSYLRGDDHVLRDLKHSQYAVLSYALVSITASFFTLSLRARIVLIISRSPECYKKKKLNLPNFMTYKLSNVSTFF